MRPQQVIDTIRKEVADNSTLPSETNFVNEEPATTAEHAGLKLPVVSFDIQSIDDIDVFNTDLDEIITDSEGNATGGVFRASYELTVDIEIMTAGQSKFERSSLGEDIWNALYPYTDEGPSQRLHEDFWMFRIDEENTVDDFSMTPTLRTWRMTCTIGSYTEFTTDESPVGDVNFGEPEVN